MNIHHDPKTHPGVVNEMYVKLQTHKLEIGIMSSDKTQSKNW